MRISRMRRRRSPRSSSRRRASREGIARAIGDALAVYLNWPRFHAVLAIVGLVALAGWLVVRLAVLRRAMTRPQAFFVCGTLAITVVTLGLLPSTPYSAGNGMTFVSGFIHWDSMRYVALLPILGWTALAFLMDAGAGAPLWRTGAAIALTIAALAVSALTSRDLLPILGFAAVGALVAPR